jgi:hypothetical protein
MPAITICLIFKGGRGHCYVTVLNSNIPIDKFERTECHNYNIPKGTYDIFFQGVSPEGGTLIEIKKGDELIAKRSVAEAGYFGKKARITI